MSHRKIPHPYYEQTGTPSSSNHPGAAEDVDAAGGPSSTIASFFDHVKFEAKKIKKGGRRNIFLEKFQARAGEKLLKASRCFLSTETGSVAGLLFISTEKIAFCSQRSITFDFPILHEATEQFEIPLRNIRGSNFGDPHQKIIRIRTEDNSEFLFIDFLRYEKARQNFETAMRQLLRDTPDDHDELKKLKGSKSRDMVDDFKSGWNGAVSASEQEQNNVDVAQQQEPLLTGELERVNDLTGGGIELLPDTPDDQDELKKLKGLKSRDMVDDLKSGLTGAVSASAREQNNVDMAQQRETLLTGEFERANDLTGAGIELPRDAPDDQDELKKLKGSKSRDMVGELVPMSETIPITEHANPETEFARDHCSPEELPHDEFQTLPRTEPVVQVLEQSNAGLDNLSVDAGRTQVGFQGMEQGEEEGRVCSHLDMENTGEGSVQHVDRIFPPTIDENYNRREATEILVQPSVAASAFVFYGDIDAISTSQQENVAGDEETTPAAATMEEDEDEEPGEDEELLEQRRKGIEMASSNIDRSWNHVEQMNDGGNSTHKTMRQRRKRIEMAPFKSGWTAIAGIELPPDTPDDQDELKKLKGSKSRDNVDKAQQREPLFTGEFERANDLTGVGTEVPPDTPDDQDEEKKLKGSESRDMVDVLKSGWTLLLISLIIEIASAVFDQLGYALVGMLLAFVALLVATADLLIHMAPKERMMALVLPISHRTPTATFVPGKPGGTIVEYFGLVGAVWQCVYSTVAYAYSCQKKDNPIKMSLLPLIFLFFVVKEKISLTRVLRKELEKISEREKDRMKRESGTGAGKEGLHNEKASVDGSIRISVQENPALEPKKPKDFDNWKNVDKEVKDKKREREADIGGRPEKGSTMSGKESDDGCADGEIATERERGVFNYGVQHPKRMLWPRGSPQVANCEPCFRSQTQDSEGCQGKSEVSSVIYKVSECMQELIKLWEEYEASQSDKNSESSHKGPTLEIRIPAEHITATNRQVRGGQLWGTDIYTNDSDLVAVLMHTGYFRPTASPPPPAIQELHATIRVLPPQDSYTSMLRNNVRSRAWGAGIGCSYRVERCCIVKKVGGIIDLEPCLTHTSAAEPTLAPVAVERAMTTRAAASNALRQQRFLREVTIQYNLCNEPWIKYSISIVSDKGLKKPLYTSARLKKGEVLYLETHSCRYELCFTGEKMVKVTRASQVHEETDKFHNHHPHSSNGEKHDSDNVHIDVFRWSRCKKPLPQKVMQSVGIPLPLEHVQVLEENLDWEDVQWSQTGVWIAGKEFPLARVRFLSPS